MATHKDSANNILDQWKKSMMYADRKQARQRSRLSSLACLVPSELGGEDAEEG